MELYSIRIFDKVGDIDHAFSSMILAIDHLKRLSPWDQQSAREFRYHSENVIFRVVGIVDRAHQVAGASMGLDEKRYSAIGGNKHVEQAAKKQHETLISQSLSNIRRIGRQFKDDRNALIHSSTFTDRALRTFETLTFVLNQRDSTLSVKAEEISEAWKIYAAEVIAEYESLANELRHLINMLLDALAPAHLKTIRHL